MTGGSTWHEKGETAIEVEDTEVGREVSIYEYFEGEWHRQLTMPAGQANELNDLLGEVFPDAG